MSLNTLSGIVIAGGLFWYISLGSFNSPSAGNWTVGWISVILTALFSGLTLGYFGYRLGRRLFLSLLISALAWPIGLVLATVANATFREKSSELTPLLFVIVLMAMGLLAGITMHFIFYLVTILLKGVSRRFSS